MAGFLGTELQNQITAEQRVLTQNPGPEGAASQACLVCRAALGDPLKEQASLLVEVQEAGKLFSIQENPINSDPSAVFEGQQLLGRVDGDDKTESLKAPGHGEDPRSNPDHFAFRIEDRSTTVAGVDGRPLWLTGVGVVLRVEEKGHPVQELLRRERLADVVVGA